MLNEDIPIGSIAKMMGHADITSTQVYAQVTDKKISNDMDKLIAKRERNRLSSKKLLENEQRSYNYQREQTISMPTNTVWMTMQMPTCIMCSAAMCARLSRLLSRMAFKKAGSTRDGREQRISYDVYSLELVIAVAFRIDSIESRAFREFIMQAIIKKQTNRPKLVCLWSKNIMV